MSIFKKIIEGELPSEKIFENERILAIKDKYPVAPFHILIIIKKEIKDIQSMKKEDMDLLKEVFEVAQKIAKKFDLDGYRIITNNGKMAGQTIFHLHFHMISGRRLGAMG